MIFPWTSASKKSSQFRLIDSIPKSPPQAIRVGYIPPRIVPTWESLRICRLKIEQVSRIGRQSSDHGTKIVAGERIHTGSHLKTNFEFDPWLLRLTLRKKYGCEGKRTNISSLLQSSSSSDNGSDAFCFSCAFMAPTMSSDSPFWDARRCPLNKTSAQGTKADDAQLAHVLGGESIPVFVSPI